MPLPTLFDRMWLRYVVILSMVAFISFCATRPYSQDAGSVTKEALPAKPMKLSGTDGTLFPFDDLIGDGRAVCFAFLSPRCPLAREYAPVIDTLAREFADRKSTRLNSSHT